jgi:hypothetical protein
MSEEDFETELKFATSMRDGPDSLYWSGYRRGLLRARFGRRVSSHDNHFAWRAFKEDDDPLLAELGRGYVDGINTVINGQPTRAAAHGQPTRPAAHTARASHVDGAVGR